MFNTQVPSEAVAVLRALFYLDCAHAEAVEAPLISHEGHSALDLELTGDI
jgi:hypothetical protein